MDYALIWAVIGGITVLLVLILYFKIQAFISLLIASITVGLIAGMPPLDIITNMQKGMADTLGFVATVVGLGAIFGAILEESGGAKSIANFLLKRTGEKRASLAMMIAGFLVAIPVFFDVAFIILVPMIYALQKKTGKSLLLYGIPLLAGLAITHSFIPPTPGPVAVADIINADLGWVILFGGIVGIPTAIISGPIFGKFIASKLHLSAPDTHEEDAQQDNTLPSAWIIISIIGIPIVLIVFNTVMKSFGEDLTIPAHMKAWLQMVGHPFVALIIANLIAWYLLGIRRGYSRDALLRISSKSLAPAGTIILLTGAGGVFKQMLIETGAGEMLATSMSDAGLTVLAFAFVVAALVRILQGSATVAMTTAAGMTAPLLEASTPSEVQKALLVIAIASGATILSHVNDSGFWLVSRYLGMSERQTLSSWTMMTTLIALVGFITVILLSYLV
ncbi:MAG: gluconate:H+ symporter [Bacteroidota bacterium]